MTSRPGRAGAAGRAGLIAIGVSVACTFAVAVAGPSVMEPALPGRPGQPPWTIGLHPSPYLAVGLTAAGLAAGTLGLVLVLRAIRGGWSVPAWAVLVAGLLAATALTLVPPFGSSDHLSYAAYGRMLVTGHNPYTTTPAQLAGLGDPVARAVQDWSGSPSVYGPLATAIQALASLAGGTSVRLTVFVLGLANLLAFAGTALLLHWMTRDRPAWQLRAALLWAANPLLLQVLVAGAHVDSLAVVFGVAAVAVLGGPGGFGGAGSPPKSRGGLGGIVPPASTVLAGVLVGLGFAVKVTIALVGLGLALAVALRAGRGWRRQRGQPWRSVFPALAGLAAGFAVTAGTAVALGGSAMLRQSSQASDMVSIGSPWRVIRTITLLAVTGPAATDIVKAGAVALAVLLAVLLIRGLPPWGGYATVTFALALAWLFAWPYVLPWYDAFGWALLALVPLVPGGAVEALCWLLLARTAALGFGYLPARQADVTVPAGLGWLQPVIRHGVTPAVLAVTAAWLVILMLRPRRSTPAGPVREDPLPAVPASASPCVLPEAGQKAPPGEAPARGAIN
jgi:hypothetical protein